MTDLVANGNVLLASLVALAAGVVSFASPCVLPLVPGYLGYVGGLSGATAEGDNPAGPSPSGRPRLVLGTALFVAGFSAVFMTMIVLATAAGSALRAHQDLLTRVGGGIVILLGVAFLGAFGLDERTVQLSWRPAAGLVGAPLLGAVFALGWTPCIGPTLGVIMALGTSLGGETAQIVRGAILGVAYCVGLGVPFLLIAAGVERAQRASSWLRRHQRPVRTAGGILLILVGIALVSGVWTAAVQQLQTTIVANFSVVL